MKIKLPMKCEWDNCTVEAHCKSGRRFQDELGCFVTHCESHAQSLFNSEEPPPTTELYCQWRDCEAKIEAADSRSLAARAACHVTQHAHHVFIKCLGKALIASKGWPECSLASAFSNNIAEQASSEGAPLSCEWTSCYYATSNAYKFYEHCAEHRFEYERKLKEQRESSASGKASTPMPCLWHGCSHVSQSISNLSEHIRSHTKEKAVACPTCGQTFSNNAKFQNHLLRQGATNAVFKCHHCHKTFSSQRILSDHTRRHVNTRKCPQCDFTLPSPSALKRHLLMRHSDERPFACTEPNCGHRCKTEDQLKVHRRRHDRSLQCYYCGQHFVTTHFLCRHLSTEHGLPNQAAERVYVCHLCQLVTKDSRCLSRHLIRMHKLARPSGFCRFRFEPGPDGLCRVVQTRLETIEVTKELLGTEEVECQLREQQQEEQEHRLRLLHPQAAAVPAQSSQRGQRSQTDAATTEEFRQQHDDYLMPLPLIIAAASLKEVEQQVLDISGL